MKQQLPIKHPPKIFLKTTFLVFLTLYSIHCKSMMRTVFTDPKVTIENVVVRDVAISGVTLDVMISIDNPNTMSVDFSWMKYQLFIEGQELLKGETREKSVIDGKKKNIITLPLVVKYQGLKSGILGVLNKKSIHYNFKGKVALDAKVANLTFDISREGDIPIPDRPKFTIENVSLKEAGFTSATLNFQLLVTNNHDIHFDVSKIFYQVKINDIDVSKAEEIVNKKLQKGSDIRFNIPVNIKLFGLKDSFVKIIKSGKLKYHFDLDMQMNSKYGPYNIKYSKESLTSLY